MKFAIACLVACLTFASDISTASATDYPTKPVRLVVPYPAGGSTDAVARMVGQKLSVKLGQPVVVDNRPGASEAIAASFVAKSAPDGYNILLATMTGLSVNPSLYSKLAYDPRKDFAPVIQATTIPSVLVVNPNVPAKSMPDLLRFLKGKPGSEGYASAGNGTPSHLGMELYKRVTGANVVHVPYKGGAPALQDLMAGQVQIMMALLPEAMPLVKAGKLKALAITTAKRSAEYPELPTIAESGMQGFEMIFWQAFVAPAGTPREIVARLNQSIDEILRDKEIRSKLVEMGLDPAGGSPEQLGAVMKSETAKWKKVVDDAGIKLD
ncbi:MFS transporter [Cupriavidus sp. TA19]|uniref:Bug family tripartite tricarboxylate transporter substrate binding protein n=1 Tax=unclassified Cupriavidus TaxID=2640874 RepID=UPI000E2EFF1E|nr:MULTISPECIES: tripartite tricarboxylate transporter substrate binding protein [unclassified Cupriavidus]BDB24081.1 tripartite tricarboxylate transporter substrate binding protein [Cupriavidus sp. P-10]GLC92784.1 MFS transporter [Cupriavidus sp. TA19]